MTKSIKVSIVAALLSTIVGCSTNDNFELSEEHAQANRENTARMQQKDRDRDHIERMRRADAFARATRNTKGGLSYSPTTTTTTVVVPK